MSLKEVVLLLLLACHAFARDPWAIPSSQWTEEDAKQILSASPWTKTLSNPSIDTRWESARPIRLALQRLGLLKPDEDCQQCYAVSVIGLPATLSAQKPVATLRATGRMAIPAYEVKIHDNSIVFFFRRIPELREPIVFRFPGGLKLGNTVHFQAQIGSRMVKQKFSLRIMIFEGALDL